MAKGDRPTRATLLSVSFLALSGSRPDSVIVKRDGGFRGGGRKRKKQKQKNKATKKEDRRYLSVVQTVEMAKN